MKSAFTTLLLIGALAAAGTNGFGAPPASTGAVLPVGRRLEALRVAERVVKREKPDSKTLLDQVEDPFFRAVAPPAEEPGVQAAAVVAVQRVFKSDEEILHGVAPGIVPTGTMLIGSVSYLLVSGRRYKVGDQISVTFDESVHAIELASIERNSYTLRLNTTELRRDFK